MAAAASSRPPNLRESTACSECAHYDGKGKCLLYNYAVDDGDTCDSFKRAPEDERSKRLWSAHRKRLERK